jgi:hypothetical protein
MHAERSYMTLGNMRANGVRMLAAWCLGRGCDHHRVLDVSGYSDELPVPSFGPRLRCERCGHLGDRRMTIAIRHRVSAAPPAPPDGLQAPPRSALLPDR